MLCCSFKVQSKSGSQAPLACVCALSQSEKPTLRFQGQDRSKGLAAAAQVGSLPASVPKVGRRSCSSGAGRPPEGLRPESCAPGRGGPRARGLGGGSGPGSGPACGAPSRAHATRGSPAPGSRPRRLTSARQKPGVRHCVSPLPFTMLKGSDFHKHEDVIQPWLTKGLTHSFLNLRLPHRTIP